MKADAAAIAEMFQAVSLGSPRNAVGFVMWRVVHRFERELEQALRPLDLTHLQFTVLALAAWMEKTKAPPSQAELARFGDIHAMQVSNVLKALERKGMIVRSTVPGGAPAKHVALSQSGLATLRTAFPVAIAVQQRLFGEAGRPGGSLLEALVEIDGRA